MISWIQTSLGELTELVTKGTTPSEKDGGFSNFGVNYIKSDAISYEGKVDRSKFVYISQDVHEKFKRSQLKKDDILFSMAGAFLGKTGMVSDDMLPANTNQAVAIIRVDKKKTEPKFIHFFLRQNSIVDFVNNMSGQSAQPNINFQEIRSISLDLPCLEEQKSIASVLSSLDDKIDLLHRQNKTLEAMAGTLFRQWFVEGAGEDWTEHKVSDLAVHLKTSVVPVKNQLSMFCHYSLPAYDAGMRPVMELGTEILSNKYQVEPWSILVSKLNPRFPRIWPIGDTAGENAVCSTEFQVFQPKQKNLYGYLYFLFRSNDAKEELTMAASGTSGSHQRVRPEDILNIKTNLPSLDLAGKYSEMVMPYIRKATSNLEQIHSLEKLRDNLLPKLMSGEVRVS